MSNKFNYDSYGNSIDGTDYCSGIETFAQNLIEDNENDASLIFPSFDGWVTPRTKDYKLTDENSSIILPKPIYKLVHVWFKPIGTKVGFTVNDSGFSYEEFKNENGKSFEEDVVDYILPIEKWATLPFGYVYTGIHKDTTLYYSQNSNEIIINGSSLRGLGSWSVPSNKFYSYFVGATLRDKGQKYKRTNGSSTTSLFNTVPIKTDPRQWAFRIEYIPISSDIKLRARKSVKQNEEYIQILNQRAEINSASALGKFMYNTAQKMGTEQITLVKFYTKIGDIPPLGCRVKHNGQHYILTANSIEMTNCVQVKVTHTLSKNWSNKSQYVSVDQKYRNYKIPADILWRNMLWEDHVVVSKQRYETEIENKGSLLAGKWLPHLYCNRNGDVTVTSLFLTRKDPVTQRNIGAVVPCTTLGPAKSIVFAGSMKDQLSAGLRINPSQPDYCEEVFYCDDNGKLKEGTITLADNIEHFDAAQYPYTEWSVQDGQEYYLNSPGYDVFRVTFSIDKDPGEALKFIYQCHFVEDDPDILIGDKLTETHHLIKKWPTDRKFRFWRLNRFLRQGVDKVYSQDGEYRQIDADTDREKYWTISIDQTDRSGTLTLQSNANNYLGAGNVGWAITDENNNLYIGCNDVSTRKLIFNFMHEWK